VHSHRAHTVTDGYLQENKRRLPSASSSTTDAEAETAASVTEGAADTEASEVQSNVKG
jgi:hypothetical protein